MINKINIYQVKLQKVDELVLEFGTICYSSLAAARIINKYLEGADREHLIVLLLNTKNKIIGINTVHVGSLNSSMVHPREVFKPAILGNAASIIVAHNHPSGEVFPSSEDLEVTRDLKEAGKILGIEVLDHIIVGNVEEFKYYSLLEKGLM